MASNSFYCRKLPVVLVDYRSNESKSRLVRSITNGTAVPFLSLSSCFNSQAEPAYCGLSTLAIILNTLRIDPQRLWKTPWRWFTEELLDCCRPLEVVKKIGITMNEFQCLARCNGANCDMVRPKDDDKHYEMFKQVVYCACTGGKKMGLEEQYCQIDEENPATLIAISYDRKTLKQTGSGHFSPIAAFDQETDSVLVLDTARFKYPPYWVPFHLLFQSMLPLDGETGQSRGYFLLSAKGNEYQGHRVNCIWKELSEEASEASELPAPHPMYNINACCAKKLAE